jgi:uncharacterized membrane protein YfcA
VLTYAFALVIGIALGLLGGGGSILTVPVFTYVAGLDPKVAIASSLPVIAVTSAVGALGHWRARTVQPRTALLFGSFAMVGGFAGARLAAFLPGTVQLLLFAVVMLGAAASMLRQAPAAPAAGERPRPGLRTLLPLGLGVGALTGLVGVGGGFLIVPALAQFGGLPMHVAVGTSLLVIAMNSAAGTLGYLGQVHFPLPLLVPFTALAVAGIVVGARLAQRVSPRALRRGFAMLLLVVATYILVQNRLLLVAALTPAPARTLQPERGAMRDAGLPMNRPSREPT